MELEFKEDFEGAFNENTKEKIMEEIEPVCENPDGWDSPIAETLTILVIRDVEGTVIVNKTNSLDGEDDEENQYLRLVENENGFSLVAGGIDRPRKVADIEEEI